MNVYNCRLLTLIHRLIYLLNSAATAALMSLDHIIISLLYKVRKFSSLYDGDLCWWWLIISVSHWRRSFRSLYRVIMKLTAVLLKLNEWAFLQANFLRRSVGYKIFKIFKLGTKSHHSKKLLKIYWILSCMWLLLELFIDILNWNLIWMFIKVITKTFIDNLWPRRHCENIWVI